MPEIQLLDRNMAFFAREFPAIHEQLAVMNNPLARPKVVDGVAIDIQLGNEGLLYRGDARELAREQVDAFWEKPTRLGYLRHEGVAGDSLVARQLYIDLMDSLYAHGIETLRATPVEPSGYLVILGVGLGYHLSPMVAGAPVRHVIVAEAIDEFLLASAAAIDWQALFDQCAEKGAQLHLVLGKTAEHIRNQVEAVIDTNGTPLLDGSYFFRHYPFFALDEAYKGLTEILPRQMIALGYYEDERKMIRNAATNLHTCGFRLVEGSFRPETGMPAFIVGSGPSLDQSIDAIREWRDHAVVFSCGSSLQACLNAGIVPDYHVELENIVAVYDMLRHIGERHPEVFENGQFRRLSLLASVTINPRVPPLFENVYFFFRDTSCSTTTFGSNVAIMNGVGPNVANSAVSCAARMGFSEMYLFGVDCGWRDPAAQHSRNTAYHTADQFKSWKTSTDLHVPGNFGGEVETDRTLDWSRDMLEQKIRAFGCTIYNCSDGAQIRGAIPKVPEAMDFTGRTVDRQKIIDQITKGSAWFEPGQFLGSQDIGSFVQEVEAYRAAIMPLVDEALAKDLTFGEFHDKVWAMYRSVGNSPYRHVSVLFHSATVGMLKTAVFFLNRIEDDEKRRLVARDFYTGFKRLHDEFLTEGRQTMEEIKAMVEGGPMPEWTNGLPTVPGTTY